MTLDREGARVCHDIGQRGRVWHWTEREGVALDREERVTLDREGVALDREGGCSIGQEGRGDIGHAEYIIMYMHT